MNGKKAKRLRREAAARFPEGSTIDWKVTGRRKVKDADGKEHVVPVGQIEYAGWKREYKRLKKESK